MNRNKPLLRTLDLYNQWLQGKVTAETAFQRLVFAELEPKEQQILMCVIRLDGATAAGISAWQGMDHVFVATVLKRLYDLGLVTRTERRDSDGRYFSYRPSDKVRLLNE